jgi:plasmid stability protein
MSAVGLAEVSGPLVNVLDMSKMIQVRNVPDEMHRALKVKAAEEGMSLSDYIKRELSFTVGRSSIEQIAERRRARGRKPSGLKTETTVQIIREARGE